MEKLQAYFYDDLEFPVPGVDLIMVKVFKVEKNSTLIEVAQDQPLLFGEVIAKGPQVDEELVKGSIAVFDKSICVPIKYHDDIYWLCRVKSVFAWMNPKEGAEKHVARTEQSVEVAQKKIITA